MFSSHVSRLASRCRTLSRVRAMSQTSFAAGTKLLVCDMAGTTVDEGGAVYVALFDAMVEKGLPLKWEDIHDWHGAQKTEVMTHFVNAYKQPLSLVDEIDAIFEDKLLEAYFAEGSKLALIDPALPDFFENCRVHGIKVGLNTGYSVKIQQAIVEKLELDKIVDGYTCAALAGGGRPTPNMVFDLMKKLDVPDANVRTVAKAGDTINDILEGNNAGCGLVVGVLSGADTEGDLTEAGAHAIVGNVTQIAMPSV